jgi:hypothetical protein
MTDAQWALIIGLLTTLLVNVGGFIANRRYRQAQTGSVAGDAAGKLSEAAKTIIETYEQEVVNPLRDRIDTLTQQLSVIEEDRDKQYQRMDHEIQQLKMQSAQQGTQIEFMKGELRRSDTALEYLSGLTRDKFPGEVDRALKIRRGQLD